MWYFLIITLVNKKILMHVKITFSQGIMNTQIINQLHYRSIPKNIQHPLIFVLQLSIDTIQIFTL